MIPVIGGKVKIRFWLTLVSKPGQELGPFMSTVDIEPGSDRRGICQQYASKMLGGQWLACRTETQEKQRHGTAILGAPRREMVEENAFQVSQILRMRVQIDDRDAPGAPA